MSAAAGGYDGGAGAGGKFRKRPFRKTQTTPYDRPPTALRPTQAASAVAAEKNGWLAKLVDPASRLITYGAHKLFSSVFRKRLLAPPQPPPKDDVKETRDVQGEGPTTVVESSTKEAAVSGNNEVCKVADSQGLADLEAILKQKTFTRSEIDHLTALLISRTADHSVGVEKGSSELKTSNLQAVFDGRHERTPTFAVHENGEHAVPDGISTPVIRSKVLEEDVASPAELAKAYMGNRSARISPTGLGLQNQVTREESITPYNVPFKPKSPAVSLARKPLNDVGTSENGFVTPRFRGRSAIYSMARTPYSRMHPSASLKAADSHGGSSLSITENKQLIESKKQALKRRSSVLENDIGSVGPIRRIRQKPNLLHSKSLTLPASGGPRAVHGSGTLLEVDEFPSSSGLNSHSRSLSRSAVDNNKPGTSSGYVPSQSIEMAQKIFEQLDKFTPKGKSADLKIDISGGTSPSKASPTLSAGLVHRSLETVGSSKILQNIEASKKENGPTDSFEARVSKLKTPLQDTSLKKDAIASDNLASPKSTEARVPSNSSHETKFTVVSHSGLDRPQKKRAFQISAPEDYLELEEAGQLNGVSSAPLAEGAGRGELSKKSSSIANSQPLKEAVVAEKPALPEPKASDLSGNKEPESVTDAVTTNKSVSFAFPVASAFSVPKSTADSDKFAPQIESTNASPLFKAQSDKLSLFQFSTSSSAALQAGTKSELPSSTDVDTTKANGPTETDKKSTQQLADGLKKAEDAPSPLISSGKGLFNFGSSTSSPAPTSVSSTPIPTSITSSPALFSSISSDKNANPGTLFSSPPSFTASAGLSNGFGVSNFTSTPVTSSAGTMAGSTFASSIAAFSASNNQTSSSAAAISVSSAPGFQFGSSLTPSTSSALGSSASLSAENAEPKTVGTTNPSSIFGTKPPETANNEGTNASAFKASSTKTETSAPASTGSIFGFQVTSATAPVSTATQSFPSQFGSSASSPTFGLSGSTNFSSGASIFGSSVSLAASPFTSVSGSSSSSVLSSMTSSASSGSGTTSSIFGSSWQAPKSTFLSSTFGTASSPSTGFSFGAAANNGSSSIDATKPSVMFGSSAASSSSPATTTSSPFVFGSGPSTTTPSSSSGPTSPFAFGPAAPSSSSSSSSSSSTSASSSANTAPFMFGSGSSSAAPVFSFSSSISTTPTSSAPSSSQPVFGNNSSTPTFSFGASPSGNNDQMSMEDSMAEDSMQAPSATSGAPVFGQSPVPAPLSGFVFGASSSPAPGFMVSSAAPPSGNPFQFGSQPTQMQPQNPSSFQASGSLEFNAGGAGSFSLGSGGGDKSNRRIVKVKSKMRRK